MSIPYLSPHWEAFSRIPHVRAGEVGNIPEQWAAKFKLTNIPEATLPLPDKKLNRDQVRDHCKNPNNPVLFGHICAMAWGGQGAAPWGQSAVRSCWEARSILAPKLEKLREGGLKRGEAYALFEGTNAVPGLGPAYFTKLLYFFSLERNCYIMDQWTAKSVNLLTGKNVVRLGGSAVSNLNTAENYEAYCREVDAIAKLLKIPDGEKVEEIMMSKGGRKPWPWRGYVRQHWGKPKS